MSNLKSQTKRKTIEKVMTIFERQMPSPKCELFYKTRFQLLVSVVLSAQATDKIVNRVMTPVYRLGFNAETVQKWGEKKLLKTIRQIGLAPTKAKNIHALAKILLSKHNGRVPRDRESLEELPGVGRKSANVIMGELFGLPTFAVDTHVGRVTQRVGFHDKKSPLAIEQEILSILDPSWLPRAHLWFVLHGRYVCKARKPECSSCSISKLCCYFRHSKED